MDEAQEPPIPDSITFLWDRVKEALHACGDPSPRDIDRLAVSCGLWLPSSTVEGWFKTWSVVPAWERFDVLIKALGAEHDQDWKALHAAAQRADRERKAKIRQKAGRRGAVSRAGETAGPSHSAVPAVEDAHTRPSATKDDLSQLQVTARVTHLPVIRATVGLEKSTIIFLLLGALLVVTAAAAFLSGFRPSQPGAEVKDNSSPTVKPLAVSPPVPPVLEELALPTERQLRTTPPPRAGAPNVLYVGDFLASETQAMIAFFLHRSGRARLVTQNYPFTAICDYLAGRAEASSVPPEDKLSTLVRRHRPRVVVLQFWGISSAQTPCTGGARPGSEDYYRRYHADALQSVQQITHAAQDIGIDRPEIVWVLQGPDRSKPERIRRLNEEIYTPVANAHGDHTSDAGWHVSGTNNPGNREPDPRYTWTPYLPCTKAERRYGYCTLPEAYGGVIQLYNHDYKLRFCLGVVAVIPHPCQIKSPAAARYSQAITHTIIQSMN